MTKEMWEKITKVMASDEFGSKFEGCGSTEDLLALLKEFDVDLSEEELKTYLESIEEAGTADGELGEDDLEMVSGGGAIWNWIQGKVKKVRNQIEYFFGGGYVMDIATGKKKHPWL